jgi:hypothetical protein
LSASQDPHKHWFFLTFSHSGKAQKTALTRMDIAFHKPSAPLFVGPPVDGPQAIDFEEFVCAKNCLT